MRVPRAYEQTFVYKTSDLQSYKTRPNTSITH